MVLCRLHDAVISIGVVASKTFFLWYAIGQIWSEEWFLPPYLKLKRAGDGTGKGARNTPVAVSLTPGMINAPQLNP